MLGGSRVTAMAVILAELCAAGCASNADHPRPGVEPSSAGSPDAQPQTTAAPAPLVAQLQTVPEYLRAACGHPRAQVRLFAVPITVPRDQCDLTGVVVLYGPTGVTVPSVGGVQANYDAISGGSEFAANVDPTTGDVTFS